MTDRVTLVEVGLRDGLQDESIRVEPATRAQWFDALADAGLTQIEAGSFVSSRWVPQMAGTDEVIRRIHRRPGLAIHALVPNEQGLRDALAADVDTIAVFTAASDTFNRRNTNSSVAQSLERYAPLIQEARQAGKRVRAYISCVVACPYEGAVDPAKVARITERLLAMGATEVSLGDTTGVARPREIHRLLDALGPVAPFSQLALHCHDTYGQALGNILTGLERGIRIFDSAVAGLGGCPYAKGASGNVSTETVLYLMEGQGLETGVDLDAVIQLGHRVCHTLGRDNQSRVAMAHPCGNSVDQESS